MNDRRSESGWYRDVASAAEVHLRDEERGRLAAVVLLLAGDSVAVREFVDQLPLLARQDLAEYLETGSMCGRFWKWREPLIMGAGANLICTACGLSHGSGACLFRGESRAE